MRKKHDAHVMVYQDYIAECYMLGLMSFREYIACKGRLVRR